MKILFLLISRLSYLIWIALCIADSALFSISFLGYCNFIFTLISILLVIVLVCIYQMGINYLDFESASDMFEWEVEKEDEDKDI